MCDPFCKHQAFLARAILTLDSTASWQQLRKTMPAILAMLLGLWSEYEACASLVASEEYYNGRMGRDCANKGGDKDKMREEAICAGEIGVFRISKNISFNTEKYHIRGNINRMVRGKTRFYCDESNQGSRCEMTAGAESGVSGSSVNKNTNKTVLSA